VLVPDKLLHPSLMFAGSATLAFYKKMVNYGSFILVAGLNLLELFGVNLHTLF
jgi:hypothetical protein